MKYFARNKKFDSQIDADVIGLITDDGWEIELQYHKSNDDITITVNGRMAITPLCANVIQIEVIR